ncbi:MAG: glycosyltransferase family 39 protein, partial [Planctomycetes bacterium]|nr:glycosyltransferase family 39 protein [Planctomycetota bacterium]
MSPIVDSATYHNTALEMARGRQGAPEPFFQPPAYPWFLSILYHLFGVNFWVVKVIQGVLGATTCMIVVAVGARMRSPKIGLAAGLVSALNGPLIFFNSQLLAVVIIALFYALSVWLLIVAVQEERWYWWLCFGFSVGLGASARPDILVLALVAVGYLILIVMIRRRQVELGLVRAALIIGSAMVPILPIAIRNTAAAGQPVFISMNAGINLYIGNNLERHRTLGIRPGEEWYELRRRPLLEGLKDTRDHDRYFQIQAVQYVVRHPGHFLRGLCEKT